MSIFVCVHILFPNGVFVNAHCQFVNINWLRILILTN